MSAVHSAPSIPVSGLSRRMTGFVRTLRSNGFVVGVSEILDSLGVADSDDWHKPSALKDAWRSLLCTCVADWTRFDDLFDAYWLRRGIKQKARVSGQSPRASRGRTFQDLAGNSGQWKVDGVEQNDGIQAIDTEQRSAGASRNEGLDSVDLRLIDDPQQMEQALVLAEKLAARMHHRLSRRHRASARGRRLDLRKVIRYSIPYGGTPVRLAFRRRKSKPLRLVMLMDASGSMSQYCPFFLRFMRGVLDVFREAEAYIFHTRLIHISAAMTERNPQKAMDRLSLMTTGWAGGTRIGESLETFNRHHARRVVNGRTVVMILSDGYDTSPPEILSAELARLRKRAKSLVWLNPMMGWKGYTPTARGMAAALPHLDLLAPAHNLRSLAALEPYLAAL